MARTQNLWGCPVVTDIGMLDVDQHLIQSNRSQYSQIDCIRCNNSIQPSIHPSIHPSNISNRLSFFQGHRGDGDGVEDPAHIERSAGYNLDKSPLHHRADIYGQTTIHAHIHTHRQFRATDRPNLCMSLDNSS